MIRKTGFITLPDRALYDPAILGKGTQAYMYFMWLCLQRLDPACGQLCFITPSQWTVLSFAEQLRIWMWHHFQLLECFQFEPFKVWPKVQTDSLIFRVSKRQSQPCPPVMFLRHQSRKMTLQEILDAYMQFDPQQHHDHLLQCKTTSTDDPQAIDSHMQGSFGSLYPTSMVADQMLQRTQHMPRLCQTNDDPADPSPLLWHRGPNTNPVYALVVRSAWALERFGAKDCAAWLRPVLYWNGKTMQELTNKRRPCKPRFWAGRDPRRLTKKENSCAEAFAAWPMAHYSLILVDKDRAEVLQKDTPLYQYLQDARVQLQPSQTDKTLAWCAFSKCGHDTPMKLIHPINFGYFSKTQPRQRFFLD
ncbi:hypothetical protein DM01DRAFT_1276783, partial [Hesseltinella vesiculosa]